MRGPHAKFAGHVRLQLGDVGGVAKAIENDIGTLASERAGDSEANAGSGTGNKSGFSVQDHVCHAILFGECCLWLG
jgi:hypothetical protein